MIKKISYALANWCIRDELLVAEEYTAVVFGLEVLLEQLVKTVGILIVGASIGRFSAFSVILIILGSLRIWTGGIHCKTSIGCFGVMLAGCTIITFSTRIIYKILGFIPLYIILLLSIIIVFIYAPILSEKQYISMDKKMIKHRRRMSRVLIIAEASSTLCIPSGEWQWLIGLTIAWSSISVLVCRNNRRESRK